MHNWYDPITERWYKMPTQQKPVEIIEVEEDIYQRAYRINRINRIWDAVIDVSSQ
jgi:hypothetical protein